MRLISRSFSSAVDQRGHAFDWIDENSPDAPLIQLGGLQRVAVAAGRHRAGLLLLDFDSPDVFARRSLDGQGPFQLPDDLCLAFGESCIELVGRDDRDAARTRRCDRCRADSRPLRQ